MSWLNSLATYAYNANKRETETIHAQYKEDVDTIGSWSPKVARKVLIHMYCW